MPFIVLTKQQASLVIAFFIFGLLIGSICSMLYAGWLIDEAAIERETLYSELGERDSRIARLEDSLQERRNRVIKGISINLDVKDRHLSLKLSDEIRQLVNDLIGREVDSLDPQLIRSIIDLRVLYVNDQPYTLKLQYLVISDQLSFFINISSGTASIRQ